MEESEVIQIRKDKIINFLKQNFLMISYVILAGLIYLTVRIRTSNIGGLKDVTTGGWTLGPDLDPFLFLRWTEYIVENGSLFVNDTMRYVPVGYNTAGELVLHTYLMAWFHNIAAIFGSNSVTLSSALYPAFMFGVSMIAFFLLTRTIFSRSLGVRQGNAIALIATFFYSVMPALLPRTIAGIPEKEASALVFMFLAFYFFILSWNSEKKFPRYLLAILAGLALGGMGHVWGGYIYVPISIGLAVFVSYILGKVDNERAIAFALWVVFSFGSMYLFSERYTMQGFLVSVFTGLPIFVIALLAIDRAIFNTKLKKNVEKSRIGSWPRPIVSIVMAVVFVITLAGIMFGPGFLISKVVEVKNTLVTPVADRLGVTVAENRQPFFSEWAQSFGPAIRGIPLTFWLFFIGSINLVYFALRDFGRGRMNITIAYAALLIALVFSRYSQQSTLNGTNSVSLFFYALGPVIFVFVAGYYFLKYSKSESGKGRLQKVDFNLIFLMSFFIISLVSARSAVRLIMMLVPSASMILAYFAVAPSVRVLKVKDSFWRVVSIGLVLIVLLATVTSGWTYYNAIKSSAPNHVPSVYNQQWQKAMGWVRDNTAENSVFGHWWDYGYWVQTLGERATVLDGGNAIPYWNHMMGRYGLTGPNEREALEFLYAHDTTHFLIDSTDIGKYSAFSSIGSDADYDRASFIPTFTLDKSQTQERKNSTVYVYSGGTGLDGDIIYEKNGTRVYLPSGKAGLGAILVEKNPAGEVISSPTGIFVYEGRQVNIPFRHAYDGEFKDFGEGINASIFLMPRAEQNGQGINIEQDGVLLYLSERVAHSQLARLYLYKQETDAFKLAHKEDDFAVAQMKAQGAVIDSDLIHFGGIRGPIRIWEINYPEDIELKEKYLDQRWPEELREV